MPEYANERQGEFAEKYVARSYDLEHAPDEADWYDCVHPRTGTKYEVKSTHRRVGEDYPADGRFRLWADQHRSLAAADGQSTAWYAFVLLDEDGEVVDVRRMRPSTVTGLVHDEGGSWNYSGHDRRAEQHKLPYGVVFDDV